MKKHAMQPDPEFDPPAETVSSEETVSPPAKSHPPTPGDIARQMVEKAKAGKTAAPAAAPAAAVPVESPAAAAPDTPLDALTLDEWTDYHDIEARTHGTGGYPNMLEMKRLGAYRRRLVQTA
jgi:hypothetical protein